MATATDFRALLGKPLADIEKPPPIPQGTYFAQIDNFETVESGQKKTPGVKFTFQPSSADSDVDPDQYQTYGGDAQLVKRKLNHTFWLTDDSLWRLKEFLEITCGLSGEGRSIGELLPESKGVAVKLAIKQRMNAEKGEIYSEIDTIISAQAA